MKMAQAVIVMFAAGIMAAAGFSFGVLAQSSSNTAGAVSNTAAPGTALRRSP